MSNQRCVKCGGTLYSDPKYGCTSLSCSKVPATFHFDLTQPKQPTDIDTADYTPQQDCKTEIDCVPWLIGEDNPQPLAADYQIATLLRAGEELLAKLKTAHERLQSQ